MDGDFQSDLRMTYCASVVAGITNIAFDRAAAVDFVQRCRVSVTAVGVLTQRLGKAATVRDRAS